MEKNVIQKEWRDESITSNTEICPKCGTELEKEDGPSDEAVCSHMIKVFCLKCRVFNVFRF